MYIVSVNVGLPVHSSCYQFPGVLYCACMCTTCVSHALPYIVHFSRMSNGAIFGHVSILESQDNICGVNQGCLHYDNHRLELTVPGYTAGYTQARLFTIPHQGRTRGQCSKPRGNILYVPREVHALTQQVVLATLASSVALCSCWSRCCQSIDQKNAQTRRLVFRHSCPSVLCLSRPRRAERRQARWAVLV